MSCKLIALPLMISAVAPPDDVRRTIAARKWIPSLIEASNAVQP